MIECQDILHGAWAPRKNNVGEEYIKVIQTARGLYINISKDIILLQYERDLRSVVHQDSVLSPLVLIHLY